MCHFHPYSQSVPPFTSCAIAQESLQAQGTTVLADSVSSDVNGILLMFSATLWGCSSSALNSGLDSLGLAGGQEKPPKSGFLKGDGLLGQIFEVSSHYKCRHEKKLSTISPLLKKMQQRKLDCKNSSNTLLLIGGPVAYKVMLLPYSSRVPGLILSCVWFLECENVCMIPSILKPFLCLRTDN